MRSCRKCWGVRLPTAVKNGACPGVAPSSSNLSTPRSLQSLLSWAISRSETGARLLVQAHPATSELFQKLSAHSSPLAPPGVPVSFGSSASKQATNRGTRGPALLFGGSANDHKWSRSHGAPWIPSAVTILVQTSLTPNCQHLNIFACRISLTTGPHPAQACSRPKLPGN